MAEPENSNWWSRNWKWFFPVGCLGSIVLFAAAVGAIVAVVFGVIRSSDCYEGAMQRVKADPRVIEHLGAPVEEGLFVLGNIEVNGPSGSANLSIPIKGSEGKGTVQVVARKEGGPWQYQTLAVVVEATGDRLDLLAPPKSR